MLNLNFKLLFLVLFLSYFLNANEIKSAYVSELFLKNNQNIEYVKNSRKTLQTWSNRDFFSKIVLIGDYNKNLNIEVKIANIKAKKISNQAIFNPINKKRYAEELIFYHNDVKSGYFELFIDGRLYDTKLFVK